MKFLGISAWPFLLSVLSALIFFHIMAYLQNAAFWNNV